MSNNQELFIFAVAILSVFSSIISIIAFLDSSGVLYKLLTKKKKSNHERSIIMRDISKELR